MPDSSVWNRAATYLGLVHPPVGTCRPKWARIMSPATDSTRGELLTGLAIGLIMATLFLFGVFLTQEWPLRILQGFVLLAVPLPLCVRSIRRFRHLPRR